MLPEDPLQDLNATHSLPKKLEFQFGNGGLILANITTPHATAHVYLHGAHVTHYQPTGQQPLLFLSNKSFFEPNKPIRGGIPICIPWFASMPGNPKAPSHGTARLQTWTVESTAAADDGSVQIALSWNADHPTREFFPHSLHAKYTVTVGPTLRLDLEITNADDKPFTFAEALHTYLRVADVRQAKIQGLESTNYLDKVDNFTKKNQGPHPITFAAETDRVYQNTTSTAVAHDPAGHRNIAVEKAGSHSTVIWNPGPERSKALPDFAPEEWQQMLCIETANVADNQITLQPNHSHTLTAVIHSQTH